MRVSPPISNVGIPEYALGVDAVEVLGARLDHATAPRETWLPASLTVRDGDGVETETTGPGAGDGGDAGAI